MSRTSPSGPVSVTDELRNLSEISAAGTPPGNYYSLPLSLALFGPTAPPAGDSTTFKFAEILGPETRAGRIGKTRVTLIADPATAGSDPITLQWVVNGIPVGTPVVLPWITVNIPGFTSLAEALAFMKGSPVEFPGAAWQPGDFVLLQVTVGTIVGVTSAVLGVTYEKNYAP